RSSGLREAPVVAKAAKSSQRMPIQSQTSRRWRSQPAGNVQCEDVRLRRLPTDAPDQMQMYMLGSFQFIPLLVRRGGCGIKKILAKPTLAAADGVVAQTDTWLVSDHPARCRGHHSSRGGD